MKFHNISARTYWRSELDQLHFDSEGTWIEELEEPFCAVLTEAEIADVIIPAALACNKLALAATEYVCNGEQSSYWFDVMEVPSFAREAIRASWTRRDPSFYGRIDFAYDGRQAKLLELNYDQAALVCESSVLQGDWIRDLHNSGVIKNSAQFNQLSDAWSARFVELMAPGATLHFGAVRDDNCNLECVKLLQAVAHQAGVQTRFCYVDELCIDDQSRLVDAEGTVITHLLKQYPWNYMFEDDDAAYLKKHGVTVFASSVVNNTVQYIEPAWKTVLQSKAILPLLWQLSPNHPCLLRSCLDDGSPMSKKLSKMAHVRKPFRRGSGKNITLTTDDTTEFGDLSEDWNGGYILQEYSRLPQFRDYHCVVSVWMVGETPAALCLRADRSRISGYNALLCRTMWCPIDTMLLSPNALHCADMA